MSHNHQPWKTILNGVWRSPIGLAGIIITTVSASLMLVGLVADLIGLISNPYAGLITYMILPFGMVTGLLLIPLAAFLVHRTYKKSGDEGHYLHINLSQAKHRKYLLLFLVASAINITILTIIAYEGYHYTDSTEFCGTVCHTVMEPEFTAYQRSPHARVACAECHIGPGAEWFAKAKISGLRQVWGVMVGKYSRPIPAPVEHLRPARETCEQCHWPNKFHGKRVKTFTSFSNDNQIKPDVTEIALHIGGRNPVTKNFEGIHWHVSDNVEVKYISDEKRKDVSRVMVKRPDGSVEEFIKGDIAMTEEKANSWRIMDCVDCHNRPTHIYDDPDKRIDFGLESQEINPLIPGIREDALTVIQTEYASRDEAKEKIVEDLMALQVKRNPQKAQAFADDIRKAGLFVLTNYLNNVWPAMNIKWGTYRSHLGHQHSDEGFGCFRCHDGEHVSKAGNTISQDCGLCHDSPF